jgi:hypothetical protein
VPAGADTAVLRSAVWTTSGGDGQLELSDGVVALTGSGGPVVRAALRDIAARPGRVHWYSGTHMALNVSGAWHQLHFRDAASAEAWRRRLAEAPPPPTPAPVPAGWPSAPDEGLPLEMDPTAAAARARVDAEAGLVRDKAWRRVGVFKKETLELRLAGNRLTLTGRGGPVFDIPLSAIEAFQTPWYRSGHVKLTTGGERHVFSLTEKSGWGARDVDAFVLLLLLPVLAVMSALERRRGRRTRREWRSLVHGQLDPRQLAWERSRHADEKAIKAQS